MTQTCYQGKCVNVTCWSDNQLAAALRLAGVSPGDAVFLVATAHPESGGCGVIQQNQPYGTTGWGPWQITPGNSEPQAGTNFGLLNLQANAIAAAAKLKSQGLSAWTTITGGQYVAHMPSARAAVGNVYGMPQSQLQGLVNSAGSNPGGVQTTAFGGGFNPANWPQELVNALGLSSFKDLAIRLGLILLGAAMLIVGLIVLAGRGGMNAATTLAAPEVRIPQQERRRTVAAREEARRATISHQETERRATIGERERIREEGRQRRAAAKAPAQGRHAVGP